MDEETRSIGSGRADPPGAVAMYGKTVASAEGRSQGAAGDLLRQRRSVTYPSDRATSSVTVQTRRLKAGVRNSKHVSLLR